MAAWKRQCAWVGVGDNLDLFVLLAPIKRRRMIDDSPGRYDESILASQDTEISTTPIYTCLLAAVVDSVLFESEPAGSSASSSTTSVLSWRIGMLAKALPFVRVGIASLAFDERGVAVRQRRVVDRLDELCDVLSITLGANILRHQRLPPKQAGSGQARLR